MDETPKAQFFKGPQSLRSQEPSLDSFDSEPFFKMEIKTMTSLNLSKLNE